MAGVYELMLESRSVILEGFGFGPYCLYCLYCLFQSWHWWALLMETRGARGPFCALSDRWAPRSASSIPSPPWFKFFNFFPSLIQVFQPFWPPWFKFFNLFGLLNSSFSTFLASLIQVFQPFWRPRFTFSPSSIHSQATPKQTGERTGCTMVAHFLHLCVLATPPCPAQKMNVALPIANIKTHDTCTCHCTGKYFWSTFLVLINWL